MACNDDGIKQMLETKFKPQHPADSTLICGKGEKLQEGKLYLTLFHGRADPKQEMDGWGEQGPTFGPLEYFQCTYGHMRMGTNDHEEDLCKDDDMIKFNKMWYGDFSVFIAGKDNKANG